MELEDGSVTEICYITSDLERSVEEWSRGLGAGPFFDFPTPSENLWLRGQIITDHFRSALGFLGTTLIEFIQPLSDGPSLFTEVLREKGDGAIHHIYPRMRATVGADYDAASRTYIASGFELALDFVVPGIGRNSFYDARKTLGCYVELVEFSPETMKFAYLMYKAHLKGIAGRPLRQLAELIDDATMRTLTARGG